MRNISVLVVALLLLGGPATGLTPEERDERFATCFEFASLVEGGVVDPHWLDEGHFWFVSGEDTLVVDPRSGLTTPFSVASTPPPEAARPWNPVIKEENLWFFAAADTDSVQVTATGSAQRPWDTWGATWSPDGRFYSVQQYDLSGTPTIPMVDWLDPAAPVEREPTTQSREPRPTGRLFIVHAPGDHVVRVHDDPAWPEPLLHPVGWHPDTGELLFLRIDRPMRRQDLLAADPNTGAVRVLIEERRDTFIDGLAAAFLLPGYFTDAGDGKHFVWLSERSGFHHLYLYRYDGTLVRPLTRGEFPVVKVEGIDTSGGWVYLEARSDPEDPTSRHLCRVRLDGKGFTRLTSTPGRRSIHLSPDFSCFVENHSDLDRPPASVLRRADGTMVAELAAADVSALEAWSWQPPQRMVVKAADGESDCFCAIYLPPDFDPALKYPVVEVIYAGPQWMIVPRRMPAGEYGDTAAALAQLGYVAVIIDSPGTADIGKTYQDAVYGKLGQIEIPDHVAALKNLAATRPWLDLSRVGVHGKSWGGYYTLRAMLQAPDFYKVGVASAPVADLATTSESPVVPYLGLPEENPEGYAAADCLPLADRLAGDLLITIGTVDRNTPFGQSMRMLKAFTEAGKDVEVLVLPGEHHWLQGQSFARWQRALRDFFREHLPPETH